MLLFIHEVMSPQWDSFINSLTLCSIVLYHPKHIEGTLHDYYDTTACYTVLFAVCVELIEFSSIALN